MRRSFYFALALIALKSYNTFAVSSTATLTLSGYVAPQLQVQVVPTQQDYSKTHLKVADLRSTQNQQSDLQYVVTGTANKFVSVTEHGEVLVNRSLAPKGSRTVVINAEVN